MQKMHFSTTINAPKKKVWDTMLDADTYREWTTAFNPKGSWYEGSWTQGSTISFLGPGENGTPEGMVSRIRENRPHEFVSIEHVGIVHDVDMDVADEHRKMFETSWPKALEKLKALAEK